MSRESIESDIRRMLGDDGKFKDNPTMSGSVEGSNSLNLSPRAIKKL